MTPTFPVSVQDALSSLYYGGNANVSWERALGGLTPEQAAQVPAGLPHSVADLVAHVAFWQTYLLGVFRGDDPAWVESAAEGWPVPGEWETLRSRFLTDLDALAAYARDETFLQSLGSEGLFRTVPLTSFAGHGLYHLGQVVTVRQLVGAWPPPGGGDTW